MFNSLIFDIFIAVREFDFSKFIQLWPAYLDSDLSLAEGRRIGKEFCCKFLLSFFLNL